MGNIKNRSFILCLLIFSFFAGMVFFMYEFVTEAPVWVFSSVNKHLSGGNAQKGKILDGCGKILAQTVNGKRIYNENESIRKAMLHAVGDDSGTIPGAVQSRYISKLLGYNFVTGLGAPEFLSFENDITLTLNADVCSEVGKSFKDKKGTALAYNYLTGELLCMVSLPTYDVENKPDIANDSSGNYEGVYLNRAFSSAFTPGSIFKVFTTIAGLDLIEDLQKRSFSCSKTKIIDGEKVVCMKNHGNINLKEALSKSCDIVFCDIALEIGKEKMKEKMEELGFNTLQYIDDFKLALSEYTAQEASRADLGWSGIGQYKDTLNPMHALKIMGAIANDGVCVEPTMIKEIGENSVIPKNTFKPLSSPAKKHLIHSQTAQTVKELMRYTMKNQYKDSMFPKGVTMCAKTGTAEVGEGKLPHGWMVGFSYDKNFPIAFAVVVENGDFGIKCAGPIASGMIKLLYSNFSNNNHI